jgi:DinB family protein
VTALDGGARANRTGTIADLRHARLSDIRSRDLRGPDRDLWADEGALWDRLIASWAGLDDTAWHLPGAAPSDAGGADWSLAEHVGHIADWQELAVDYTARAMATGEWPADSDYDGGDFDTYNERRREPWASLPSAAILARLEAARPRLLELAHALSAETIRTDPGWAWVYPALHGHYLDHLAVIEPWTGELRRRTAETDPLVADAIDRPAADH